ncbi:thioredoxin [Sphaerochaeta pleomorpha str. Grapes]|uniref:Thioredoxin n=1 Tax=Sphaerochaeta pleomorpha (strain ATCC BAA-1885 / DSM 22778 / Grapes) TaxID=158190 RepID=G8QX76_SPHPG|nr:thioredoxin [Sphaerochaeta pleomorpha]AEV30661.1 thioredoxin [Sphaerochaeta pleomorpha str. Grapes]
MSEISITEENFEDEVLKSDLPVLVDFWAEWCGPCKMIAPAVAQLAEKYKGKLKVAKVNVDEAGSVASMFNVSSIPTLMIFKKGEVVAQRMGAASLSVLDGFVSQNL